MKAINNIAFYTDTPEIMQEHSKGIVIDDKFTGVVEQGGKYADTYYFIDGHALSRDFNGDDNMQSLVVLAIACATETALGEIKFPELPPCYEYTFDGATGQPQRDLVNEFSLKLLSHESSVEL